MPFYSGRYDQHDGYEVVSSDNEDIDRTGMIPKGHPGYFKHEDVYDDGEGGEDGENDDEEVEELNEEDETGEDNDDKASDQKASDEGGPNAPAAVGESSKTLDLVNPEQRGTMAVSNSLYEESVKEPNQGSHGADSVTIVDLTGDDESQSQLTQEQNNKKRKAADEDAATSDDSNKKQKGSTDTTEDAKDGRHSRSNKNAEHAPANKVVNERPAPIPWKGRIVHCRNCNELFDKAIGPEADDECVYHPGMMVEDEDLDFFADFDLDYHNCGCQIDGLKDDYPEAFVWDCCEQEGGAKGCQSGHHKA